jgi:replicative DNA helicase
MKLNMHDEASEQALLGACLLNARAILVASEYVTPSDFYFAANRDIFGAIVAITARGGQVDPVSVSSELGKSADREYIFSLPTLCPAATNVSGVCDRRTRGVTHAQGESHNRGYHEGSDSEKLLSVARKALWHR